MSYADITKDELKKQEVSIKSFIKEEKEEDRWMNSTKCNIIVHGLGENKCENKEEQQVGDKNYVEEEIRLRMGFKVNVVTAERIGIRKDEIFETNRWRPLKVILRNEEQKKQIMASVHKIDDNWDFRISDDFSKKERVIIKEWHRKAKEKTNKDCESCVWKVRGSPRTKLYLKKFVTTKYCKQDRLEAHCEPIPVNLYNKKKILYFIFFKKSKDAP